MNELGHCIQKTFIVNKKYHKLVNHLENHLASHLANLLANRFANLTKFFNYDQLCRKPIII